MTIHRPEIKRWFAKFGKIMKTTADTYLDITEKIEEDELQKFASYTKK